jgi:uncharacterized protein YkwD
MAATAVLGALASGAMALPNGATASSPVPTPIPANSDWLTTVNYFRAMVGVPAVAENLSWSTGSVAHSNWMVETGTIAHDEPNGGPFTTPEGDLAGNNGNVAVSSNVNTTAREHIELWMSGPFHALGILRPQLTQVGYGQVNKATATRWRSAATLDVLRGLDFNIARPTTPITFPGNGTSTSLTQFITESPNPLDFCSWTGEAGLPVFAMMPEETTGGVATMTGPAGPLEVCSIGSASSTGVASQILDADNAVIVIPRRPLTTGTYNVSITTASRTVAWSFNVDPSVADGAPVAPPSPLPPTTATGPLSTFLPLAPERLVDTRGSIGATRLVAGQVTRIDVAGKKGVPTNAAAVSANFTIVESDKAGFLTVYPCGPTPPDVSTLNFGAGEAIPNQATVPLDATGDLCVVSTANAHLIVDVNGALADGAPDRYAAVSPERILDTRNGLGGSLRLAANATARLAVVGKAGVPAGATAVALNVTAVNAGGGGFVTVYPCGAVPNASNLNVSLGTTRPNLVIVPLSAAGEVCLRAAEAATDLLADVAGYYSPVATQKFTPLAPVRMLDTRSSRADLNGGSAGAVVPAQRVVRVVIAGQRGVPANAKAVSINLTVTGARGGGFVTAYPCGTVPNVSNVNFAGADTANAAQVTLDSGGALCLWSSATTHLLFDVNGVWA